jgi:hypothetical protein
LISAEDRFLLTSQKWQKPEHFSPSLKKPTFLLKLALKDTEIPLFKPFYPGFELSRQEFYHFLQENSHLKVFLKLKSSFGEGNHLISFQKRLNQRLLFF